MYECKIIAAAAVDEGDARRPRRATLRMRGARYVVDGRAVGCDARHGWGSLSLSFVHAHPSRDLRDRGRGVVEGVRATFGVTHPAAAVRSS